MAYINGREILFSTKLGAAGAAANDLIGLIEGSITAFEIPEGTKVITEYAFYKRYSLAQITIAESVKTILNSAFWDCSRLKSVTFKGKPNNIYTYAFGAYVESIECPWKEGEVKGAPWGATSATIIYTG